MNRNSWRASRKFEDYGGLRQEIWDKVRVRGFHCSPLPAGERLSVHSVSVMPHGNVVYFVWAFMCTEQGRWYPRNRKKSERKKLVRKQIVPGFHPQPSLLAPHSTLAHLCCSVPLAFLLSCVAAEQWSAPDPWLAYSMLKGKAALQEGCQRGARMFFEAEYLCTKGLHTGQSICSLVQHRITEFCLSSGHPGSVPTLV